MYRLKKLIQRYNFFIVFIFFLSFWFSIFIGSGSIFSGYHFVDDHEILAIQKDWTHQNIVSLMGKWVNHDFEVMHRFKPFYYLHRVVETRLFGVDFTLWHAYNAFLAVLTSIFIFIFARRIGFSIAESVLLPLMTLVGKQAVIWWSLGPNEAIGMVMLAVSLVFMAYSVNSKKGRWAYDLLFVFFAILMSLSKESFILLIPALLFWKIWLVRDNNSVSWFESFRANVTTAFVLLSVMFAELLIILKCTGISGYSRVAGGLDGFQPLSYVKTAVKMTLSVSSVSFGLVSLLGIILLIIFRQKKEDGLSLRIKDFFKDFLNPIILFLLITIPQFVLYARSGFLSRYLLPLIFGYTVFLLYLYNYLRINSKNFFIGLPAKEDKKTVVLSLICCFIGCALLLSGVLRNILVGFFKPKIILLIFGGIAWISMAVILLKRRERRLSIAGIIYFLIVGLICYKLTYFVEAHEYALHGKQISSLVSLVDRVTQKPSAILIVSDPIRDFEAGSSLKEYLKFAAQREHIYINALSAPDSPPIDKQAIENYERLYFGENRLANIKGRRALNFIIIFPGLEGRFLGDSSEWFNPSGFIRQDNGFFVVYYKKF